MQAQKINMQNVYNIHTIIYIKDNLAIKRNNNDDKMHKLSKKYVDDLPCIMYNKDTLKNGHLKRDRWHTIDCHP